MSHVIISPGGQLHAPSILCPVPEMIDTREQNPVLPCRTRQGEPGAWNQLSPPGENQTATEQGPGRGSEKGTSQDKGDVPRGEALVPRVRHTSHIQERSPLLISAGPEGPVCGNLVPGPGNTGTPGLRFEDGAAAGKWDFNAQRLCVCRT